MIMLTIVEEFISVLLKPLQRCIMDIQHIKEIHWKSAFTLIQLHRMSPSQLLCNAHIFFVGGNSQLGFSS